MTYDRTMCDCCGQRAWERRVVGRWGDETYACWECLGEDEPEDETDARTEWRDAERDLPPGELDLDEWLDDWHESEDERQPGNIWHFVANASDRAWCEFLDVLTGATRKA
jgi:hypothetical protein